jgi:4-amino-4-deoxy-L-arabinose transferase-like glycosyltransferase
LGVRLYSLSSLGGFDFDEIVSFEYAELPLSSMLRTVAERPFEHPPLYYGLLHLWFSIPLERTESFVRLFSVALGTLTIPVAYLLGVRLLNSIRSAWLAALLVALSPLEVFFSREARMYVLLTFLGMLSIWLLFKSLERGRWWWAAYAGITLLALYTHYIAIAVILAENLFVAWVWRRNARLILRFAILEIVVAVAHLPWLNAASGLNATFPALGTGSWSWSYLGEIARQTWFEFVVGPEDVARTRWAWVFTGIVWLLGLLGAMRLARRQEGLLLAGLLVGAVAALAALIAIDKPFHIRYLLILHVPLLVLVAGGLERLRTWYWWLAAAALALAIAFPLAAYYTEYERGDYQRITQRIELLYMNGDEVVLTGPWQERFWCHYATRTDTAQLSPEVTSSGCRFATKHDLFVHRIPLSVPPPLSAERANQEMQFIYGEHAPSRLWFVQAGLAQADPANHVERWLTENAWQGQRIAYRNGTLSLWAVAPWHMPRTTPKDMTVGDVLAVDWYEIQEEPLSGSVLRMTFGLRLLKKTDKAIKLSFRLYDGRGEHVQRDVFVGHPHHPTHTWEVGEQVTFRVGLLTPPGAKPGKYSLGAIFYVDAEPPLPIAVSGQAISEFPYVLAEVELQRSAPQVVDPTVTDTEVNVQFGDPREEDGGPVLALEGHGISNTALHPEDKLQVVLVWRSLQPPKVSYLAELRLVDADGTLAWEHQRVIGGETYRVDAWIRNDFVRDWYLLELNPTLPEGDYDLQLRVLNLPDRTSDEQVALTHGEENQQAVSLGAIQIRPQDAPVERPQLWQRALRRLWREVSK